MSIASDPDQGHEVCFSSPWMKVVAIPAENSAADPHYVVVTKDYVSVVAMLDDGKLLAVRQHRPAVGGKTLEFPAGHVEVGQTPEQAARQELLEETGYKAASMTPLGVMNPDTGRLGNRHWCFFATGLKRTAEGPSQGEQTEVVKISVAELQQLILRGDFCHAQHLAALQMAIVSGKVTMPAPTAAQVKPRVHADIDRVRRATLPGASDVCVIGGGGHVGLPLSLVLARAGLKVLIYDTNEKTLQQIAAGKMPFVEDGAQELLDEALQKKTLRCTSDPSLARGAPNLIVTIGTPVDEFLNPNMGSFERWVESFLPYISDEQLIILRSTLYPGATNWLDGYLRRLGHKSPRIAFCPERIVQGLAIKELPGLPQIVSGTTQQAEDEAADFWGLIAPHIVRLSPMEAEFAKLFCNAYRYIQFAAANQLFMITTEAGVDFNRITRGLKDQYPRMRDFPNAGFTAGPCLFKDTMQLAAFAQNQFTLGHAAMQVNEGLVLWMVNELARRYPLEHMTVGLLGMAFKADIDDNRASLSYKFKKAIHFKCGKVLTADPHVTTDPDLVPSEELVEQSDLLILCAPHKAFAKLDTRNKPLVDVWGVLGDTEILRSSCAHETASRAPMSIGGKRAA